MTKKVAVILAGCGHQDGAEIREAVITLLELDKLSADVTIFAPNTLQHHVLNHVTGEEMQEKRNVMVEAARIARGAIKDITTLDPKNFDALVMPGGFGVAKNLSDIAFKGEKGSIVPEVKNIIRKFLELKKPIGAICISPAIVAAALEGYAVPKLTLGEMNPLLKGFGANEEVCTTTEICVDNDNRIISTPAYMYKDRIANVAVGIEKLVKKVMEIA